MGFNGLMIDHGTQFVNGAFRFAYFCNIEKRSMRCFG
jgi:hypothetical protein